MSRLSRALEEDEKRIKNGGPSAGRKVQLAESKAKTKAKNIKKQTEKEEKTPVKTTERAAKKLPSGVSGPVLSPIPVRDSSGTMYPQNDTGGGLITSAEKRKQDRVSNVRLDPYLNAEGGISMPSLKEYADKTGSRSAAGTVGTLFGIGGSIGKAVTTVPEAVKGIKAEDSTAASLKNTLEASRNAISQIDYLKNYKHKGDSVGLEKDVEYQTALKKLESASRVINAVKSRAAENVEKSAADKKMDSLLSESDKYKGMAVEGLSPAGQFAGQVLMSGAENLAMLPLAAVNPALYSAAMAANVAGRKMYDVEQSGGTAQDAITRGIGSGAITYGTSKIGLDNLLESFAGKTMAQSGLKNGLKSAARNIGIQAGSEGLEEGLEYIGNYGVDKWGANDPNAKFSWAELGQNALAGAAAGGLMGGIGSAAGKLNNYAATKGNVNTNTESDIILQQAANEAYVKDSIANAENARSEREKARAYIVEKSAKQAQMPLLTDGSRKTYYVGSDGIVSENLTPEWDNPNLPQTVRNVTGTKNIDIEEFGFDNYDAVDEYDCENIEKIVSLANKTTRDGKKVMPYELINTMYSNVKAKTDAVADELETYIKNYKGKGVEQVGLTDGYVYENGQVAYNGSYRVSNNDVWYSDFYKKYGRAPRKSEARGIAQSLVEEDIRSGRGEYVDPKTAKQYRIIESAKKSFDKIADKENIIGAVKTDSGIQLEYGNYSESIVPDYKVRNGKQVFGPVPQKESANAEPVMSPVPGEGRINSIPNAAVNNNGNFNKNGVVTEGSDTFGRDSIGAAKGNPDSVREQLDQKAEQYGAIPEGEKATRYANMPKQVDDSGKKMSRFARTLIEAEATSDSFVGELEKNALEGNYSHEVITDKAAMESAERYIQANGYKASYNYWRSKIKGSQKITKDDIAIAQQLYNQANNYYAETGDKTAFNEARQIAADLVAEFSTSGQVTQAARMMKKTTPDGNLYALEKLADKINKDGKRLRKQNGEKVEVKINGDLARQLLQSNTEAEMLDSIDAIKTDMAGQLNAKIGDMINEWRYFSMLANPKTHIRNIVGNSVMKGVYGVKDVVGTAVEGIADVSGKAMGKGGLEEKTKAILNPLSKADKALIKFAESDYENTIKKSTGNKYSELGDLESRINVWTQNPVARKLSELTGGKSDVFGNMLNFFTKGNTKLLDAEDNMAIKQNYKRALAEYMKANKHSVEFYNSFEGQQAFTKAKEYALKQAKEATFHDDSKVADAISRFENINTATKFAAGAFVPFKKTPINIAKRSLEYSPLGFAKAGMDAGKGAGSVQVIDDLSKAVTGTGLMVLGAWLASKGIMNGVIAGDDEKERGLKLAEGKQDFAINVGDKSITVDTFAPSIIPMLMGASLYETANSKNGGLVSVGDFADAVAAIDSPMIEMSVLSALDDMLTSIKYSEDPVSSIAASAVKNYAGQFIPTMLSAVARTTDDTKRSTYIDKNSPYGKTVEELKQSMKYKTPTLHQTLEPTLDVWGREQSEGKLGERIINNFLNPTSIKTVNETDIDKELERLYKATGESGVITSKPDKYINVQGTRIDFTSPQYTQLVKERNSTSYKDIESLMKTEGYNELSDDEKAQVIQMIYDYNSIKAKEKVTKGMATPYTSDNDKKVDALKESGFTTAQAMLLKHMMSGIDDKEAQKDFIQGLDLSEREKNAVYDNLADHWTYIKDTKVPDFTSGKGSVNDEEYMLSQLGVKANKAWPRLKGSMSAEEFKEVTKVMNGSGKQADKLKSMREMGYTDTEFYRIWNAFNKD